MSCRVDLLITLHSDRCSNINSPIRTLRVFDWRWVSHWFTILQGHLYQWNRDTCTALILYCCLLLMSDYRSRLLINCRWWLGIVVGAAEGKIIFGLLFVEIIIIRWRKFFRSDSSRLWWLFPNLGHGFCFVEHHTVYNTLLIMVVLSANYTDHTPLLRDYNPTSERFGRYLR
jgi:hypothetical protein